MTFTWNKLFFLAALVLFVIAAAGNGELLKVSTTTAGLACLAAGFLISPK